jgi:hypothetical protein
MGEIEKKRTGGSRRWEAYSAVSTQGTYLTGPVLENWLLQESFAANMESLPVMNIYRTVHF